MNKCVFCELLETNKRVIVKNDSAWAFPTNIPIVPGHTLVCPKRCVSNINNLTGKEVMDILGLQSVLKRAMRKVFKAEGFNYAWNEERVAGQSLPHLHLHMVPRKAGDAGIYEYEPRKFLYRPGERNISPEKELDEIARLLRSATI